MSPLDAEIDAAIRAGTTQSVIRGDGAESPGTVTVTLQVTPDFPLVTLVTMVAPSPDWFVGVDSMSLVEDGHWVSERVVPLRPWAPRGARLYRPPAAARLEQGRGRDRAEDLHANDLLQWQTTIAASDSDIAWPSLLKAHVLLVSPGMVTVPSDNFGFQKGIVVRDPDRHVVRIVER